MSEKYTKDALDENLSENTSKKPSFITENRAILKKLVCVFLLAGLFMVIEIVGGILAGSIAILSDAAHMLSDLLGFVISIISVWISGFPANKKHSYGFHRAGVIGALGSVMVIWMLTAFLIYFAVMRAIHIDQIQVEGKLMFCVACFGLGTNLIMVKVLHGDHGGHGHHNCHSHENESHHHDHHHSHKDKEHGNKHENHHHHKHEHDHKDKSKSKNEKDHDHEHHSHHVHETKHQDHEKKIEKYEMEKEMVLIPIHSDQHMNEQIDVNSPQENSKKGTSLSQSSAKSNLNVRATIIHILGDILQSIGVIIASALIWAFPHTMKLADPIITFVFAIIILFTTIRVARDCIVMLMEATPGGFDVDEFEKNMRKLNGVVEVHDLHVWSLGEGKPAMSVHIHTDDEILEVLSKATDMCRAYGITHSTIQVEGIKDKGSKNYIDCDHNIH